MQRNLPGWSSAELTAAAAASGKTLSASRFAAATPNYAIAQLAGLDKIAVERLYPHLPQSCEALRLGSDFAGSALCIADADLIVDGLLIDLKTHLGALNKKTGARSEALALADVYQLVGYALFDCVHDYGITAVGLCCTRRGAGRCARGT